MSEHQPAVSTDLHTHYTGVLTADKLVEIGAKHDILIPCYHLDIMGIPKDGFTRHLNTKKQETDKDEYSVTLQDILASPHAEEYKKVLSLPPDEQSVHADMSTTYDFRWPYFKQGMPTSETHPVKQYPAEMTRDMLREIATQYKGEGVDYAELSITSLRPEDLANFHEFLPEIEKETGVSLRFLASAVRRAHVEDLMDTADKIIALAKDPYVVGCDFLGHESNETKHFQKPLEMLAEYAMKNDPTFCIRVHAGENENYKDNVADVFKIIKAKKEQIEAETGEKVRYPECRIGHGLYGLDEETKSLCKELNATIEINSTSNYMLNNIDGYDTIPAAGYLEEGINIVYGSDGTGIYGTNAKKEVANAMKAGVTAEGIEKTIHHENRLKSIKHKAFGIKMEAFNEYEKILAGASRKKLYDGYFNPEYQTATKTRRYTDELRDKYRAEAREKQNQAKATIKENGINMIDSKTLPEKTPIFIAGIGGEEFAHLTPEQQTDAVTQVRLMAKFVDPEKSYFIVPPMSGAAKHIKESAPKETQIVSYLSAQSMEEIAAGAEMNFTDGIIGKTGVGKNAENDFTMVGHIAGDVKKQNGTAVFLGGKGPTKDYIQDFNNEGIELYLSKTNGASKTKAERLSGVKGFMGTEEFMRGFYETNRDKFVQGFDIDKLNEYIMNEQIMQKGEKNDITNA